MQTVIFINEKRNNFGRTTAGTKIWQGVNKLWKGPSGASIVAKDPGKGAKIGLAPVHPS